MEPRYIARLIGEDVGVNNGLVFEGTGEYFGDPNNKNWSNKWFNYKEDKDGFWISPNGMILDGSDDFDHGSWLDFLQAFLGKEIPDGVGERGYHKVLGSVSGGMCLYAFNKNGRPYLKYPNGNGTYGAREDPKDDRSVIPFDAEAVRWLLKHGFDKKRIMEFNKLAIGINRDYRKEDRAGDEKAYNYLVLHSGWVRGKDNSFECVLNDDLLRYILEFARKYKLDKIEIEDARSGKMFYVDVDGYDKIDSVGDLASYAYKGYVGKYKSS